MEAFSCFYFLINLFNKPNKPNERLGSFLPLFHRNTLTEWYFLYMISVWVVINGNRTIPLDISPPPPPPPPRANMQHVYFHKRCSFFFAPNSLEKENQLAWKKVNTFFCYISSSKRIILMLFVRIKLFWVWFTCATLKKWVVECPSKLFAFNQFHILNSSLRDNRPSFNWKTLRVLFM